MAPARAPRWISGAQRAAPAVAPAPRRLPRARTSVTLCLPNREQVPAWVRSSDAREIVLVAIIPLPALDAEDYAQIVLEFGILGGRVRLSGRFAPERDAPEVIVLRKPRLLEVVQERVFPRARASVPVSLRVGETASALRAYTVDVSAGGCLLDGAGALRVGETVHFEISLGALDAPLTGSGHVVRIDQNGRRGVAFDAIAPAERDRLDEFVAQRLLIDGPA